MGIFYTRLSYSIGNEDWQTEQKALQVQPNDQVLCVTASGDRPLNLLLSPCKKIFSVDANPFQNALLELKRAALQELDYEHYLSFLGIRPHSSRWQTHLKLEPFLSSEAVALWRKHPEKITRGILYEGAIEKLTRYGSFWLKKLRGNKIDRLFSFSSLEEQKAFIDREWDTATWKNAFHLVLNPVFTRFFLRDPGLYAFVDPSIRVNSHLYDRMTTALKTFSPRESIILSLVFQGKVYEDAFAPYLSPKESVQIRSQAQKISTHTGDVISYLESLPENSIDCFSLSDVASYISYTNFCRLVKAIYKAAAPGARFCLRQFLSRYDFPPELAPHFQRNYELEKTLENEDKCFIYYFLVGTIHKQK